MCTNTLAYDGTVDNNLRYVGNNPCNYVTFNNETPVKKAKEWRNINPDTGRKSVNVYDTLEECNNHNTIHNNCQIVETIEEGWRIIGVMNNVDDGTGKKESRIKLIRTTSLGYYSWDTSEQITNTEGIKICGLTISNPSTIIDGIIPAAIHTPIKAPIRMKIIIGMRPVEIPFVMP